MKCFRVNYCLLTKTNSMRFFFKTTWCSLLNTRTTHNEPCRCKAKTNSDSFVRSPLEFDNRGRVISSNVCVYCEIAIALFGLNGSGPSLYQVLTLDVLLYIPRSEISLANPKSPSLATLFSSIKMFLAAKSPWIHYWKEHRWSWNKQNDQAQNNSNSLNEVVMFLFKIHREYFHQIWVWHIGKECWNSAFKLFIPNPFIVSYGCYYNETSKSELSWLRNNFIQNGGAGKFKSKTANFVYIIHLDIYWKFVAHRRKWNIFSLLGIDLA